MPKRAQQFGADNRTSRSHTARARDERPSAAKRGYDRHWRKARLVYLGENPLCVRCGDRGFVIAAEVVDHVVPHKGNRDLFWDRANWQALCKPCHDWKTLTEDVGSDGFRAVIYGPPGSGKTTFVERVRRPGDLVFDLDRVAEVLFQLPSYPRPEPTSALLRALRDWLVNQVVARRWAGSVFVIVADVHAARSVAAAFDARLIDVTANVDNPRRGDRRKTPRGEGGSKS